MWAGRQCYLSCVVSITLIQDWYDLIKNQADLGYDGDVNTNIEE